MIPLRGRGGGGGGVNTIHQFQSSIEEERSCSKL